MGIYITVQTNAAAVMYCVSTYIFIYMEPELTFSLVRSLTGRILIIINICLFVSTQEKQTIEYTGSGIRLLGNKTPYTDKIRLVEIKK